MAAVYPAGPEPMINTFTFNKITRYAKYSNTYYNSNIYLTPPIIRFNKFFLFILDYL